MNGTDKLLRACLVYDPDTGILTWCKRPLAAFATPRAAAIWNSRFAGKEAGGVCQTHGYRFVGLRGQRYRAHRLAWMLHYGEWPVAGLDHLDGDRTNNRISNLREATSTENQRNMKQYASNQSGRTGVHWRERQGKWNACINVAGRYKHLGTFDSFEAACKARTDAEIEYGFHPNHGREI